VHSLALSEVHPSQVDDATRFVRVLTWAPFLARFGRRKTLVGYTLMFCVGAVSVDWRPDEFLILTLVDPHHDSWW
jgi:hypothetical protein